MYGNILVPLDGSNFAEEALSHAITLARVFGSRVTLIYVIEPMSLYPEQGITGPILSIPLSNEREEADAKAYLHKRQTELTSTGIDNKYVIEQGDPASEIIDYSTKNNIDLIVMTTHGRSGVGRLVYGSVADRVLRQSKCPVLLIRSDTAD